jgi:hypothetical protein
MKRIVGAVILCLVLACSSRVVAQGMGSDDFSRKNTFTLFAEYSNTSSHILLGESRQRKLADFGGGYSRRLVRFGGADLSYVAEIRPVLFESDPLTIDHETIYENQPSGPPAVLQGVSSTVNYQACHPGTATYVQPPIGDFLGFTAIDRYTCGRRWTYGQTFEPLGVKYSTRTRHPLQPFVDLAAGYMFTTRPVPMTDAEAFNFVFHLGAGVEVFQTKNRGRSIAVEARLQHFSNKNTAPANPGTDNIVYRVSYSFGK